LHLRRNFIYFIRYLSAKFYLGKRNFNIFAYLHRLFGKFILTGKNRAHFTEIDYL